MYKIKDNLNDNIKDSTMFKRHRKKEILKVFKTQITDLFIFIQTIFPNNKDISFVNKGLNMFVRYNSRKLIELWYYYIAKPYYELIMKGDFYYFENKNYREDLKDLNQYSAEYMLNSYDKLRGSIAKLDNSKKMMAMRYVQVLTKLSEAYILT